MQGANIMEINYYQSLMSGPRLLVRLICECDLYAKMYGSGQLNLCYRPPLSITSPDEPLVIFFKVVFIEMFCNPCQTGSIT